MKRCPIILAILTLCATLAEAATFTTTQDTDIVSDSVDCSPIDPSDILVGRSVSNKRNFASRGLFRFNLSSIPAGSAITSATFNYYVKAAGLSIADTCYIRGVTSHAWVEGEADWHYQSCSTTWGTNGGDFTTTNLALFTCDTTTGWKSRNVTALISDCFSAAPATCDLIFMSTSAEAHTDDHNNSIADPDISPGFEAYLSITYSPPSPYIPPLSVTDTATPTVTPTPTPTDTPTPTPTPTPYVPPIVVTDTPTPPASRRGFMPLFLD